MRDVRQMIADAQGDNPRLALVAAKGLRAETDWLLVRAVRLARAQGYDWGKISRLLGVSRQAARQRFDRLAPTVGPTMPHTRGRTPWEQHAVELAEATADLRRRREFEAGDAVFW
ncbi:MAG TPA: hypothetical protein PK020_01025 [Ilumatobacteraceae bacterium]|nr:hypothetical protein [Ilumatobacteraceae bacterium]HRB02865.1 hypothetical protein [Ilumatobacteraceae bacterium]